MQHFLKLLERAARHEIHWVEALGRVSSAIWTKGRLAGLASLTLLLALFLLRPNPLPLDGPASMAKAAPLALEVEAMSIWITFGLRDTEENVWDGELTVSEGEILEADGWHFLYPEFRVEGLPETSELKKDRITREKSTPNRLDWECTTRRIPLPPELQPKTGARVRPVGIVVKLRSPASAEVSARTRQGNFSFILSRLQNSPRLFFLDGSVRVEVVPSSARMTGRDFDSDYPSLAVDHEGNVWLAWIAYRGGQDQILVRRKGIEGWSTAAPLSDLGDYFGTAAAVDGNSRLWVVWSARVNSNWDLFGRCYDPKQRRWGDLERITEDEGPDLFHRMITDKQGRLYLVWQGFREGQSDIHIKMFDGRRWSSEIRVSPSDANDWEPAVAVDRRNTLWIAWDGYDRGNYDVYLRSYSEGKLGEVLAVAPSPHYQARAGVSCDPQGRVWIAWEESGVNWGKDYGSLVGNRLMEIFYDKGQKPTSIPLYLSREIRVACLVGTRFYEPVSPLASVLTGELGEFNGSPVLAFDAQGLLWLVFRHRTHQWPGRIGPLGYWEIFAVSYNGQNWSFPTFLPQSVGPTEGTVATALDSGGRLWGAWASDQRLFVRQPARDRRLAQILLVPQHYDIFASHFDSPAPVASLDSAELKVLAKTSESAASLHPSEKEDVRRMRRFQLQVSGKRYRIYRGDLHRHTDISYDGASDGSLTDAYRYALDAAALDFFLVTDHNHFGGFENEYSQWRIEKYADLFLLPGRFTTLFGYERSVSYPNGHRNIVFTRRGIPPLPISGAERLGKEGASNLYAYLRRNRGIAMPHTSGAAAGTDWRDNDPEVEPLVEIYQGCRTSYEYEGAPKAASEKNPELQIEGFHKDGFVWNAWAKGYTLGVQASSDHYSTHISYAALYATEATRGGLMQAMRQRHSYGATDNIVLDFRIRAGGGEYLMGDILRSAEPPLLLIHVLGTGEMDRIDIIKNNAIAYTRRSQSAKEHFTYLDNDFQKGKSYYYVRVLQKNGQMAWSSPIWVSHPAR